MNICPLHYLKLHSKYKYRPFTDPKVPERAEAKVVAKADQKYGVSAAPD